MNAKARRKARIFALQALYQWQMNQTPVKELQLQYRASNDYHKHVDWPYFDELITGVSAEREILDGAIGEATKLPVDEINPVELALLRLGAFELKNCLEVPYQVVLDEYVTIAKEFAAHEGHQFINAILEKIAKQLRTH